ncbi:MAG: hypothetical protein PVJ42_07715 [bacterium]
MAKEKVVRCRVSKNGSGPPVESTRYVPLDVYDLWKHLMVTRHGFEILEEQVSLWFDIDGDPHVSYSDADYERVMRLSLWVYSDSDRMFRKVVRYFPEGDYPDIRTAFLSHYEEPRNHSQWAARLEERSGVWVKAKG